VPRVLANGIEIEYETFGDPGGVPILLIAGLGVQMLSWDDGFCELLASRGFRVIRFDNRDCGLSTWMEAAGPPDIGAALSGDGQPAYHLDDMAADAAGLPILPGLVRWDEVQAGAINHAIRFTAQQSDRSFLWPARHQAGTAANGALPPMGARFRLKSTYDISHFSAQAQVILVAMQHYGLILADNGSNWFFSGTEDASWPDSLLSELKTIPASQFDAIDESSVMIDANSAAARQSRSGWRGRRFAPPPAPRHPMRSLP